MATQKTILFRYLKFLRRFRKFKRKVLGVEPPRWYLDIIRLIKYINFFPMITSVLYLISAPNHFFKRLQTTIEGKSRFHKSPIAFFTSGIVILKLLVDLANPYTSEIVFLKWLVDLANPYVKDIVVGLISIDLPTIFLTYVSLPILIPIIAAQVLILSFIMQIGLPFLVPRFIKPRNPWIYLLIIDPRSYVNIKWPKFLWGIFYFQVLWMLSSPLFLFGFFGLIIITATLDFSFGSLFKLGFWSLFMAWVLDSLILQPYAANIRAALKKPTGVSIRLDNFSQSIEKTIHKQNEKSFTLLPFHSRLFIIRREVIIAAIHNGFKEWYIENKDDAQMFTGHTHNNPVKHANSDAIYISRQLCGSKTKFITIMGRQSISISKKSIIDLPFSEYFLYPEAFCHDVLNSKDILEEHHIILTLNKISESKLFGEMPDVQKLKDGFYKYQRKKKFSYLSNVEVPTKGFIYILSGLDSRTKLTSKSSMVMEFIKG